MKTILGNYEIMSSGGNGRMQYVGNNGDGGDLLKQLLAVSGADAPDDLKQVAMERILASGGLVLKQEDPTHARTFPLGFLSNGAIGAGASVVIVSRPQVLFKGRRLVVPSDIAGDFSIDDVKVGKNSQFVAEGAIPARVLQENAFGVEMELDTAQISQDISLAITNISGAARVFRAALLGRAAE